LISILTNIKQIATNGLDKNSYMLENHSNSSTIITREKNYI